MKRNGNAERRGGGRGACGADVVRRRIEDRGVGCGEGVSNQIFDFGSQYGEFRCILGGIFTVQLPVVHAEPEFNRYRRIKAVMVSR